MSKITPKNLQYDNTLPPFLARLQANNNSRDSRHEYNVARPKKARNAEEEAEDEPVYFDEGTGETLTKREWEEKDNANEEKAKASGVNFEGGKKDGEKAMKEKVACIGVSKKRKAGKIIGGEDEDEKEMSVVEKETPKPTGRHSKKVDKSAKKGKKVKLSFGDDE